MTEKEALLWVLGILGSLCAAAITIDKVRDAFRKAQETPADENQFRQLRLRAAGVMPHCMDQVDLCCADPFLPHREQDQFFRFACDLCDFSFRNIHRLLRASLQEVVSTSLYVQSIV